MNYQQFSVQQLCGLFGKSRRAYYRREERQAIVSDWNLQVLEMVKVIRRRQPRLGTPKLYEKLKANFRASGIKMGRDALNDLIQANGLGVRQRKRRKPVTTYSNHPYRKYPNLIFELVPDSPNQIWVSDITYITLSNSFAFLTLITDTYSRKIVGYNIGLRMTAAESAKALEMAFKTLPVNHQLIHHSDRGSQYCSRAYIDLLKSRDVRISMTQSGSPYDNAIAERINGTLKNELHMGDEFSGVRAARERLREDVLIYNCERPHASIEMMTPQQAHQMEGPLKRLWKSKSYDDKQYEPGGLRQPPVPPGRFVYHGNTEEDQRKP